MRYKEMVKELWWIIVLILVAVKVVFFFVEVGYDKLFEITTGHVDVSTLIYNYSAPIIGVVTIILLLRTLLGQRDQFKKQQEQVERQKFETSFFNMLAMHNNLIDGLDIRRNSDNKVLSVKRDCFRRMYNKFSREYNNASCSQKNVLSKDQALDIYDVVQDSYKGDLHNYFRYVYHVLKYVHSNEFLGESRYEYIAIYRALFSPYELAFIFYNCLHEFGNEKFYPLVHEYSFLKNIDFSLLHDESHRAYYHEVAYADRNDKSRKENLKDWNKKQKKSKGV